MAELGSDDDHDSTLGETSEYSTTSLTSNILDYRQENGRTYHGYEDGKYLFPNDKKEENRLDLQHHLLGLTFEGQLHSSPLKNRSIHNALDIGTGTGIWAIDFADVHPETQVLGIDLSPIQPIFVPPNLKFEVDDIEKPWTFKVKFDFIFCRMMSGAIKDWVKLFERSFENLSEGGVIEVIDMRFPFKESDKSLPAGSALNTWAGLIMEATTTHGCPMDSAEKYKSQLQGAGFIDIVETTYAWPQNRWPKHRKHKELGVWALANFKEGLEGFSLAPLTRVLGWSKEEVELLCAKVWEEMKNTEYSVYWEIYVIYAQKS